MFYVSGGKVTLRLEYAEYSKAITHDRMIKLMALLIDAETRDFYRAKKTIMLDSPEIIINVNLIFWFHYTDLNNLHLQYVGFTKLAYYWTEVFFFFVN